MIPRVIHYVWVGPKPLPDADRRRVDAWRRMLPSWEFRFWGNDNIDFSPRYLREAFAVRAWNRVSDYVRMSVLAQHGGVYLDTDVDLIRPLDPLLDRGAFLGFQAGEEWAHEMVNGAVFGAVPGHWLPREALSHFNEQLSGRRDTGAYSGPGLLTEILGKHGLRSYSDQPVTVDQVTVFPKRYFYPYSWNETYSDEILTPDTFAVHRWALSWVRKRTIRTHLRRAMLDHFCRFAPDLALHVARLAVRQQM